MMMESEPPSRRDVFTTYSIGMPLDKEGIRLRDMEDPYGLRKAPPHRRHSLECCVFAAFELYNAIATCQESPWHISHEK